MIFFRWSSSDDLYMIFFRWSLDDLFQIIFNQSFDYLLMIFCWTLSSDWQSCPNARDATASKNIFLDPKDLRNWLCHSVTPSLRHSVTDVFETEIHCLVLYNFKIQPQLYSMVKYLWLDLIIMVGFNYIEWNRDSLLWKWP